MRQLRNTAIWLAATIALAQCGPENQRTQRSGRMLTIPIEISSEKGIQLLSMPEYHFRMRLVGCLSGFTNPEIPAGATSIEVFEGDEDCVVELYQVLVGETELSLTSEFTDYQIGDTGEFSHPEDSDNLMRLTVTAQLSSPVVETDAVSYLYSEIDGGSESEINADELKNKSSITVEGAPSPAYEVAALQTEKAKKRKVKVTMYLDCQSDGSTQGDEFFCENQKYSELHYRFVQKPDSVDLDYLEELFGEESLPVSDQSELTDNGFKLQLVIVLKDIVKKQPFVLALRNLEGSYSYYNIKIK